jgi:hypothetical protein
MLPLKGGYAQGILVNCVAPRSVVFPASSWARRKEAKSKAIDEFVRSNMPLGRFGTPEEIADADWERDISMVGGGRGRNYHKQTDFLILASMRYYSQPRSGSRRVSLPSRPLGTAREVE